MRKKRLVFYKCTRNYYSISSLWSLNTFLINCGFLKNKLKLKFDCKKVINLINKCFLLFSLVLNIIYFWSFKTYFYPVWANSQWILSLRLLNTWNHPKGILKINFLMEKNVKYFEFCIFWAFKVFEFCKYRTIFCKHFKKVKYLQDFNSYIFGENVFWIHL